MGGRGTFASGNHVAFTYDTIEYIEDAKVLKGKTSKYHSLPAESHSSNKYIKLDKDGTVKQLRVFNDNHLPVIDVDYHVEYSISGTKDKKVLHYHVYDKNLVRSTAKKINKKIYDEYIKYFQGGIK